jgi:putative alpha-1,2-mannosidase
MGFYPLCPGTTQYVFTSPVFSKITLRLPENKAFVITATSNNEENVYVQKHGS